MQQHNTVTGFWYLCKLFVVLLFLKNELRSVVKCNCVSLEESHNRYRRSAVIFHQDDIDMGGVQEKQVQPIPKDKQN